MNASRNQIEKHDPYPPRRFTMGVACYKARASVEANKKDQRPIHRKPPYVRCVVEIRERELFVI